VDSGLVASAELSEELAGFRVCAVGNHDGEEVDLAEENLAHSVDGQTLVFQIRVEDHKDGGHTRVNLSISEKVVSHA